MSAAPIPRSGQTMPKQLHPNKRTGTGPGWEVAGGPILLQKSPIPRTSPLASAEFATIRERLTKIGARGIEHIARIRGSVAILRAIRRSQRSCDAMLRPGREF
jgi:hypothetical protein